MNSERSLFGYVPGDAERCILSLENRLGEAENREKILWKEYRRMEFFCSGLQDKLRIATGERDSRPQGGMGTDGGSTNADSPTVKNASFRLVQAAALSSVILLRLLLCRSLPKPLEKRLLFLYIVWCVVVTPGRRGREAS